MLDILVVLLVVPESPLRTSGRFDYRGALGLSVFLVCLLLAVSKGERLGLGSPATLGLFAGAVVVVPLWTLFELRTASRWSICGSRRVPPCCSPTSPRC